MSDRLFKGYGPLIGLALFFAGIVTLVPSTAPEGLGVDAGEAQGVTDLLGDDYSEDDLILDEEGNLVDPETGEVVVPADEVDASTGGLTTDSSTSGGDSVSGGPGGSGSSQPGGPGGPGGAAPQGGPGGGPGGAPGGGGPAGGGGPPKVAGCGAAQVAGDPYSPPCIEFSGSNGGATHRGVSDDEIVVAVRIDGFDSGLVDAVTKSLGAAGKIPSESRQKVQRTIEGLAEYFNRRFQFYGRKVRIQFYDGKGDPLNEVIGQGQEAAKGDALKVSKEFGAFADISAVTAPYAAALASEGVINIGAPYVPRNWLAQRRPYSWTPLTDCTTVVESAASYYVTKMGGGVAANADGKLNGKELKQQPRRVAVVAPENAEYQACVGEGIKAVQQNPKSRNDIVAQHKYRLSTNPGKPVADIIPKLVDGDVTTLMCGCDPLFLNFLSTALRGRNYYPEIIVMGVALVDTDLVGQLMDQSVWRNAFGISYAGATQRQGTSPAYRAYKSVNPDEPSVLVDVLYSQLYMLSIGIQMAGPNLTPQSFEKGMFDYPSRSGPYGKWGFGPNDYSTSDDAREIFWNPGVTSPQTGTPGAYQDPNGGRRFPIGKWPGGNPRTVG